MNRLPLFVAAYLLVVGTPAAAQLTGSELRALVSPLPTELRAGAGIYVETRAGAFEHVRESRNGMSCVRRISTSREGRPLFDVRCYSDLMWPSIFFRWSIDDEHESYAEAYAAVERGAEAGRFSSIHFPFRTAEELGLTRAEEANREGEPGMMPWVMASGTWWSHVMIVHR